MGSQGDKGISTTSVLSSDQLSVAQITESQELIIGKESTRGMFSFLSQV